MKKLYIYIFIFLFIILGTSTIMNKEPNLNVFNVFVNWVEDYPEDTIESLFNSFLRVQESMDIISKDSIGDTLYGFWKFTKDVVLVVFDLFKFLLKNILWVLSIFKYFLI